MYKHYNITIYCYQVGFRNVLCNLCRCWALVSVQYIQLCTVKLLNPTLIIEQNNVSMNNAPKTRRSSLSTALQINVSMNNTPKTLRSSLSTTLQNNVSMSHKNDWLSIMELIIWEMESRLLTRHVHDSLDTYSAPGTISWYTANRENIMG